jgi:hypothetical protein
MTAEYRVLSHRVFTDERLRNLTVEHRWIYTYAICGLQNCALTHTGIYKIGRGEMSVGANIDMEKTEQIIDFFNKEVPSLLQYDIANHMIYLPSFLKYSMRYGYTKKGVSLISAIHKDFKRYGNKAPEFFNSLVFLYEKDIQESFLMLSEKDKNFQYYKNTLEKLFSSKPSTEVKVNFSEKINQNKLQF